MKLLGRLFCIEFRRAIVSKRFIGTVFFMLLLELLSSSTLLTDLESSIIDVIENLFAGTGSAHLLLGMLPLLPFSLSYAEDIEENALNFILVRSNTVLFMLNRFFVACLSAFLCVVISFSILILILFCMGHPLFLTHINDIRNGYAQFLTDGNGVAYLFFYVLDRGLSATMMAGCAIWVSTILPNAFFAFTAPICIYFLALRIIMFPTEMMFTYQYLQVQLWFEGTYDSPNGGLASFLCKLGVTAMICMIYGAFSIVHTVRRWHYA